MTIASLPWFIWDEIFKNLPERERLAYRRLSKEISYIITSGVEILYRFDSGSEVEKDSKIGKNLVKSIAVIEISRIIWKRLHILFPKVKNIAIDLDRPPGTILSKNLRPVFNEILSLGISLEIYFLDYGTVLSDDWLLGLNITSLDICINQLDPNKQLQMIERIRCPHLKRLGLSYVYPSNYAMNLIAKNHPKLSELYLMYMPGSIIEACPLPELKELRKAVVAAEVIFSPDENIRLIFPNFNALNCLKTLCLVDIADQVFGLPKISSSQITELGLFNTKLRPELMSKVFPNIITLTYELGVYDKAELDISSLTKLKNLTLIIPRHNVYESNFCLNSSTVTHLNIRGAKHLSKAFWGWIAAGFTSLFSLQLTGYEKNWCQPYLFGQEFLLTLNFLTLFYSYAPLPQKTINGIKSIAPNLQEFIISVKGKRINI